MAQSKNIGIDQKHVVSTYFYSIIRFLSVFVLTFSDKAYTISLPKGMVVRSISSYFTQQGGFNTKCAGRFAHFVAKEPGDFLEGWKDEKREKFNSFSISYSHTYCDRFS